MLWKDACFMALENAGMFENSGHRTRFHEMLDCYANYPFFTKGLCKCMYLSAWDEEHFVIMLETLTNMALGQEEDTEDMKFQGDVLSEENMDEHAYGEALMFQISGAFLENRKPDLSKLSEMSEEYQHIVDRGMKAAEIIEGV